MKSKQHGSKRIIPKIQIEEVVNSYVEGYDLFYEDGEYVRHNDIVTDGEKVYVLHVYDNFIEVWENGKRLDMKLELEPMLGWSFQVQGLWKADPIEIVRLKKR